jgi:TolB-like protein/Tfp pilus assembly protein PilF
MRKFLAEMRRRRVLRVAGIYVVAAWVAIQAAGEGFAAWQIPEETLRIVWICALVGFPLALIFGWYYDVTGNGIVRTAPAASGEDPDLSLHKADYLILTALLVIFVLLTYRLGTEVSDSPSQHEATGSFAEVPENSIAVLPFVNMSADPDNDYFSDGISEELLNDLAQLAGLHVAARTSAFFFKGKNENITSIAAQLGVRNVLEGSVRKAGNKLRITAQLIDASNGYHLWSATYDRELGDVFAIQDDISASVIDSLKVELLGNDSDRLNRQPTENMEAYDAYLVGRQQLAQGTSAATHAAVRSFEHAIELDPKYALAYVGVADAYLQLSAYGSLAYTEIFAHAEPAIEEALELDSQLGEAYAALGLIETWRDEPDAAEAAFKKAIRLNPGYSRTYLNYGIVLKWDFGKVEEALAMHQKALGLDPLSVPINMAVADDYQMLGRHDEALIRSKRVIEIDPDFPRAYVLMADMYWEVFAQLDQAVTWLHKAIDLDRGNPEHSRWLGMIYADLGDFDAGTYWIRNALETAPDRVNSRWGEFYLEQQRGSRADVSRVVREILRMSPQSAWAKLILAHDDAFAGEIDAALKRAHDAVPDLANSEDPGVSGINYGFAIDLAYILIKAGERKQAEILLNRSLSVMRSEPRLGYYGFKIRDVEAHAMLGKKEEALSLLRSAVDEGWRYGWRYDMRTNAHLESIRTDPRFQAIAEGIGKEMAEQLAHVNAMKTRGDLPAPEKNRSGS